MNKNKLKVKWVLGIYKVLPEYPTNDDILFDLIEYLYQKDQLKDHFTKNLFKIIYGKTFTDLQEKIDRSLESLVNEGVLKIQETKNKQSYIIDITKVSYLN